MFPRNLLYQFEKATRIILSYALTTIVTELRGTYHLLDGILLLSECPKVQ